MELKTIFNLLPVIITILGFITKRKVVNSQNGEKYAKRELCLDVVKVVLITIIALVANFMCGADIPIVLLSIDVIMLIVYLLPFVQKNYEYTERKALMGILSGLLFQIIMVITLFEMMIGTYDKSNPLLLFCLLKGIFYFSISLWSCYSADKKFFSSSKKHLQHKQNAVSYYTFAFITLFIFIGHNNYFTPICLFGIHEILNKKHLKGILYIILGNICLYLQYKYFIVGVIPETIYLVIAFIDLFVQYKKEHEKVHSFS